MSSVAKHAGELAALLGDLRRHDIKIQLDGDSLRVRGAKANLGPELAARIQARKVDLISFLRQAQSAIPSSGAIPRREPGVDPQLSFIQQNLWLIDQLEGSVHYNMAVALNVEGRLDAGALELALCTIVQRHETLRTVFRVAADGAPRQIVLESYDFRVQRVDLSGSDAETRGARARELTNEEARAPFDLAHDLMMRSSLLTLAPDRYVLLVTMHHIASDGWSMDVFMDELCRLYEAYRQGEEDPLPPLPIQYADYSVWLSEWLQGETLEKKLQYWREQLGGLPALHSLPLDQPRPPYRTILGKRYTRLYSLSRYDALLELCKRHDVTLFVLLEAAFALFLSRWSAERDIAIATPISSRSRPELASLIGFFTNTLVLRSDCDENLTFVEFLQASRKMMFDAHEHHHIPFEQLVDKLNPPRSLAYNALAQISFKLQNNRAATMGAVELPGVRFSSVKDNDYASMKFDLDLTVKEDGDGLLAKWDFNTDIFDLATVKRMDRHFECLLESILSDPEQTLGRLKLIPESELARIDAWNATDTAFAQDDTLSRLFEVQAQRTPDAPALLFEGGALSYAELNCRANRLAHRLIGEYGVGPGTMIGHCFERSPEMMVAALAILKAGGAYVALDPGLPAQRLEYMLDDSAVPVVLTQTGLRELFSGRADTTLITLDAGGDVGGVAEAERDPAPRAGAGDLAYVIYTSGSTGRPKGTLNLHSGVCNRLHAMQAQFGLDARDRVLQKTPLSFDVSVWELFWPLATGATLVLAAPEGHKDPVYLSRVIVERGITLLHFVPSMLQAFVTEAAGQAFPSLRYLITSGEALSYELQVQCIELLPHVRKINQYGPTEAAIDVTWWSFDAVRTDRIVPIGRPADNVRIHILDRLGQPVPVGVAGELFIGGVQVGAGYHNNPQLTAQRFVDRVIGGRVERLYQSGDAARWLDDGEIEYLGRLDHQVKLRGFRIELGEIEASLDAQPGVSQSVVSLWAGDGPGHENLIAYVVGTPDPEILRATLRKLLPEYMVPIQFVRLHAMPLTRSGKIDRRALPAPTREGGTDEQAPSTPTEEMLAGVWAEVLRREPPGMTANFFELGGHSLLATQLASAIRRRFDVEIPLRMVFERPTLRDQAVWLSQQQRGYVLPPILPRDPRDYALSYAQRRLWLLSRLEGVGATYNIPRALLLRGELDANALERAFARVVERHSNLRLCFPSRDERPAIALLDAYAPLRFEDISGLPAAEREAELSRRAEAHARQPFDLAGEALLRVKLLKLDENRYALLVNMHHIVSDGWSIGVMMREVGQLYTAFRQGCADPLPALAAQYPDYALWQREWLAGDVLTAQRAYWRAQLQDAPALLSLPTDRPRPPQFSYRGAHYRQMLDAPLREAVARLSRKHGSTAFMTVLAAFKVLLARYSGQDDICVGTPIANRAHHQTEPMIGCFVNTLVLRSRVDRAQGFAQLLGQVRRAALDAYHHQDLPFEQLVEELKPARSLSHTPLFQVVFRYESRADERVALPGVEITEIAGPGHSAQFDLLLNVIENANGLQCEWEYATDLFDETTIARMHGHLNALLTAIATDHASGADTPVGRLPWLADSERLALLTGAGVPAADAPAPRLLHRLFEAHAELRPRSTALSFGAEQWSYAELNRRANRIAHRLISLGVKPDERVGLCAQRGPELLAGLLGILKAGGAYVPLDPAQPRERLQWMIEDSALMAILAARDAAEALPAAGANRLWLDDEPGWTDVNDGDPAVDALAPHHLAYVIYTSGSTGRPKGVQVEHRQAQRLLSSTEAWFGFGPDDVWTLFHSFAFDFSVWEMWGALAYGGRLVIVSGECARSPRDFYELLCRERATVLNQTPSAFRQLIAAQAESGESHALRVVVFGGEALEPHALKPWIERNDPTRTRLVNMYGITETTVHVTYRPLDRHDIVAGKRSVIGRPIPDMRVRILDPEGEPVPVGVAGEMYVGGAGVARGYLRRDALTAERFLDDPFAPGERLYRTGDLARWTADGDIEYLGRNDFQVKIRGFRIELGEIEARLTECTGVREATVIVREDAPGEQRLIAYVVGETGTALAASDLREALAAAVPEYMVPAAFVTLAALPLTGNGKLDRQALPAPGEDAVARRGYAVPQGERECEVAGIWRELLSVERIGRFDNFFELGGHSLLVISMIDRLRRHGWEADVRLAFTAADLADLAAHLHEAAVTPASEGAMDTTLWRAQVGDLVRGGAEAIEDAYPLSPLQEGMLFHHLLGERENGDVYRSRTFIAFNQRERLDAFLGALQVIIDRHDILRTSVHWDDLPRPLQVVHRRARLRATEWEGEGGASGLRRLLTATDPVRARLNLRAAPILAAHVALDEERGEWVLALLTHHIVEDNYSQQIKLREVREILAGRGDALPAPRPYRDFIARLEADSPARHEAYFRECLGDVDTATAPFAPAPSYPAPPLSTARERLNTALAARLREAARGHGVSPAVLFHLAWAQVLARCADSDDVVFGTVLSGRLNEVDLSDGVVGMFINTLPLRVRLGGRDVVQALTEVQHGLAGLIAHEQAPLALAQRCSAVAQPQPLFNALLNYRHARLATEDANVAPSGMRAIHGQERSSYPLSLVVEDAGDAFELIVQSAATVEAERLLGYAHTAIDVLATALIETPRTPVLNLEVVPEAEHLAAFNRFAATEAARGTTLHGGFEAMARTRPDAIAAADATVSLSYAELDGYANRTAHALIGAGVRRGDRVALLAERGVATLAGLLAILKAGAAYVPLDPAHPRERLRWQLADCEPTAVLGDRASLARVDVKVDMRRDGDAGPIAVVALDDDAALRDRPASSPEVESADSDAAYVIYTSGSTGLPKGVVVEHRSVLNLWRALEDGIYGACDADARIGLNAGLAFDASLQALTQWLSGRCVVVVPAPIRTDGAAMVAFVHAHALQALDLTPSQLRLMAAHGLLDAAPPLRALLVGGEALDAKTWAVAAASPVQCFNVYGPTECCVDATCAPIVPGRAPHIGRPLANVRAYVLDAQRRPMPIGAVGELYLGGDGVARGYLNRAGLNAERFMPDPFAVTAGARMYRTGDLCRWNAEGDLEYLGRNDEQIKLRGHRIEPGEVEAALAMHEGVSEARVLARTDNDGETRLVAYLIGTSGVAPSASSLRAWLAARLPESMLPSAFVPVQTWPLTANGKLDRAALPAADAGAFATAVFHAPVGDSENTVAGYWRVLLGIEQVGRDDDFFALGGHSLLATQLLVRLRESFALDIPLTLLFRHSTVASQAAAIVELALEDYGEPPGSDDERYAGLSDEELQCLLQEAGP